MIKKYHIIPPLQYIKNQILTSNSRNCPNPHIQAQNKSTPLLPHTINGVKLLLPTKTLHLLGISSIHNYSLHTY